jgi:signal transduction histidine kinase/ligand-binding sensor domain-containing protein
MKMRALLGVLCVACPCAFALNPALEVSQYAHTSWRNRDGFARSEIDGIVQTADGYLWLATQFGILRFDGVRTAPWQPPPGQRLPSDHVMALLAARNGALWIGTERGLASWKNGKLREYPELAGLDVGSLVEDHVGAIWAGAYQVNDGKLCEIRGGNVHCDPEIHGPGQGVMAMREDSRGNLWVATYKGVWRWKPKAREYYPTPDEPNGIRGFADSPDGGILIAAPGAVRHLSGGKSTIVRPFPDAARASRSTCFLRDRDGGLWVGTTYGGIVHVHNGSTDVFAETDGLSGNFVTQLFEDREGNIWIGTSKGLDRFREMPVVTLTLKQGLSSSPQGAVLAARDGSVWAGMIDGLNGLNDGRVTAYRARGSKPIPGINEIEVKGMPQRGVAALFQDSRDRIWFGTPDTVGYLEDDRFVASAPGGNVDALAEDAAGNIWFDSHERGLTKITPQGEITQTPWTALGHKDTANPMVPDPARGGLWLGFYDGGIGWFRDGGVRKTYTAADGLAGGRVTDLRFDSESALWVAAQGGVSRVKNGRITNLNSRNGLPCDTVFWTIEDDDRSLWLYMPCGLVRIARAERDAWLAAPDNVHRTLRRVVFDNSDGAASPGNVGGYTPRVARSRDGRLWFKSTEGISFVDPHHLPFNNIPPPVHVEQITADRKIYDATPGRHLPPLVRDLEIDYTALSLVAPEKNKFRYKLEGYDSDWQDAGTRRQTFYTNLSPRHYRFRVMASNNSGVWNEAGASLDFSIDPAWYQTRLFQAACVATFLLLLAGFYRLRLRQVTRKFDLRMEERVNERTRIARDLHDTLLQSFQGVLLKFSALSYKLPENSEARADLEDAIDLARDAVTEGRDAVQGLRQSTLIPNDLARSIGAIGEELAGEQTGKSGFRIHVEGAARDLPPLVRDEVYRIAVEALRNAFRHSGASQVEVEIRYDSRRFTMRVRDNGKGIDPQVIESGRRAGHHGLPGMHERAGLAGGTLAVWSKPGTGTEIELTISAAIAYRKVTLTNLPKVAS